MAPQLGTVNRMGPAAWGLSNAECLIGKAWILLRDQGFHGNVKGVRPGLRLWTKESTGKLLHVGRQKVQLGAVRHTRGVIRGRAGSELETWLRRPWDSSLPSLSSSSFVSKTPIMPSLEAYDEKVR